MSSPRVRIAWLLLGSLMVLMGARTAIARVPIPCVRYRAQDEIWLVSTLEMGNFATPQLLCRPQFCYQRFCGTARCGCGVWQSCDACDFWSGCDANSVTIVNVHGNRMTEEWVKRRGLDLYNGLTCGLPEHVRIRYVIWSWPAETIPNRLAVKRDARVKYRRTPLQAYYLAWWLNQFSCEHRISLIGYSYGAEAVFGSLHLLAGGQLNCRRIVRCCGGPIPRIRLTVLAPATQSDALLPCGRLQCALKCVESGLIFYNRCDPALRCFNHAIFSVSGPALGYVGLIGPRCCYPGCGCICQFDATRFIGRHHNWDLYRRCAPIMRRVRCHALWQDE